MTQSNNEQICDICGKTIIDRAASSDVTRYLFSESRCQCIRTDESDPIVMEQRARKDSREAEHKRLLKQRERLERVNLVASPSIDASIEDDLSNATVNCAIANLPDRYQFIEIIGEGGMGAVVKARDIQGGAAVAVKMLRPQLVNDKESLHRFQREVLTAAKLDHFNIAKIFDSGMGKCGAPYLVMEYVEGENLAQLLKREGQMKPKRALELFIQMAQALSAAHQKGILHRDVKPSNIIIQKIGEVEVVKLVDFGIAKSFISGSQTLGLTQTGMLVGSPAYMSPEQCLGLQVDVRSDIYSLGCVMFETLCSFPPFEASNPVRTLLKHIEEYAPPVVSMTKQTISDDLNYIVMHCLDKDERNRYQNVEQLLSDLQDRRNGRKVSRAAGLDYSPVSIKRGVGADGNSANELIAYTKKGWKPVRTEVPYAEALLGALLISFPIVVTFFWLHASSAFGAFNLQQKSLHANDPVVIAASANELAKKDLIALIGEAHQSVLDKKYAKAATQFRIIAAQFGTIPGHALDVADNLTNAACCYTSLENYPESIKLSEQAEKIYQKSKPVQFQNLQEREIQNYNLAQRNIARKTQPKSADGK